MQTKKQARLPSSVFLFQIGFFPLCLPMSAAADLIASALIHEQPGYNQYFPAQTISVTDLPVPEMIRRFYSMVPLRRPIDEITNLVDLEAPMTRLAWTPPPRLACRLEDLELPDD